MEVEFQARGIKRPPPLSTNSDATSVTENIDKAQVGEQEKIAHRNGAIADKVMPFKKPIVKKTRTDDTNEGMDISFQAAKDMIGEEGLIISFDQMKSFNEKCQGQSKIYEIALEYRFT